MSPGQAPEEPIVTIRPRVTDTTHIVPVGRFQLEAGVSFGYGGFKLNRQNVYSPGVLRYGVTPRLEARLELPAYTDFGYLNFEDGFGNVSVALSYFLGRVGRAGFSVLPRLTLPTAVEFRRPEEASPSIFLTGELPLDGRWTLASTVGALHQRFFGFDYDFYRVTLCADYRLDDRISGFVEYAGIVTDYTDPSHASNVGLRYRSTSKTQFDFHATSPISNGFPQSSVGFGYSVRF